MRFIERLKQVAVSALMLGSFLAGTVFLTPSPTVSAAACTDYSSILTFPNWYRGVYKNTVVGGAPECNIEFSRGIMDIWVVVSNIIEILLQLVGYVAVAFVIYGGFRYLTSQGESAALTAAKDTITRAVVGLIISIVSVLILNFALGIFGLRTTGSNLEIVYTPELTTDSVIERRV